MSSFARLSILGERTSFENRIVYVSEIAMIIYIKIPYSLLNLTLNALLHSILLQLHATHLYPFYHATKKGH